LAPTPARNGVSLRSGREEGQGRKIDVDTSIPSRRPTKRRADGLKSPADLLVPSEAVRSVEEQRQGIAGVRESHRERLDLHTELAEVALLVPLHLYRLVCCPAVREGKEAATEKEKRSVIRPTSTGSRGGLSRAEAAPSNWEEKKKKWLPWTRPPARGTVGGGGLYWATRVRT